jgi:hypothetical protein
MQLTKRQLKRIIKEELTNMVKEGWFGKSKKEKKQQALKDKLAQFKANRMSPAAPEKTDQGDDMRQWARDQQRELDPSYVSPEEEEQAEIDRYLALPKAEKTKYIRNLPASKRREFMRKASGKTPLQEKDDLSKIVSPDVMKKVEKVATELKDLDALDDAIKNAATEIAQGNEQIAQAIIPLIRQKFAEA